MNKKFNIFRFIASIALIFSLSLCLVSCNRNGGQNNPPVENPPVENPPVVTPPVIIPEIKVSIDKEYIFIRETAKLNVSFTPSDYSSDYKVEISDTSIATHIGDGIIEALGEGTVTITVTSKKDASLSKSVTLTVNPDLLEESYKVECIATTVGEDASTEALIKYQTYNKNTSVEYTLSSDTEFNNALVANGSGYYFCEQHVDLDGPFSERYIYRVYLDNLTPDTEYIYRVNQGDGSYSEVYKFKTAKGTGDTTFIYLTDTHYWVKADGTSHGSEISEESIKNILLKHPDATMVVDSGDTIDTGGNNKIWDIMYKHRESLKTLQYVAVPGNHEYYVNGTGQWDNRFFKAMSPTLLNGPKGATLGSSYYFIYNDVLFLMLDNVKATGYNEQFTWMEKVLRETTAKYIVVNYHIPTHEGGTDQDDKYNDLFQKYGVDLVLSGHYHTEDYDFIYNNVDINSGNAGVHFFRGGSSGVKGGTPVGYAITITTDGKIFIRRYSTSGNLEKTYELETIKYKEPVGGEVNFDLVATPEENIATLNWGKEAYGYYKKITVTEKLRNNFSKEVYIHSVGFDGITLPLDRDGYDSVFEISCEKLDGTIETFTKEVRTSTGSLSVSTTQNSATLTIGASTTPMFSFLMTSYNIYLNGELVASNIPYSQTSYVLSNLSSNTTYKVELHAIDYDDAVAYTLEAEFKTK